MSAESTHLAVASEPPSGVHAQYVFGQTAPPHPKAHAVISAVNEVVTEGRNRAREAKARADELTASAPAGHLPPAQGVLMASKKHPTLPEFRPFAGQERYPGRTMMPNESGH